MNIQTIPIANINPAPYNPRLDLKPGDRAYEQLKGSITQFGYVEPLVWNKQTQTLVGGHQRFKILRELGYDQVEVVVVDLPLEKEKALNLTLNKVRGEWDNDKLASLLVELKELPDFDVSLTGFDLPEITELLDQQQRQEEDDFDVEAAVEAIETPVTQRGDLIELGRHRILCGDSANADDLKKLLGEERVPLLFTDPPYSVAYLGGNRPNPAKARPKSSRNWQFIYNDNLSQAEYEKWLRQVLTNTMSHLAPGASIYIWNGHRQFGPMHQMSEALGFHVSCVITWAKPNFAIGYGDYNQATEFCLYGWKGDATHRWFGPTNESTLWEVKRDPTKSYIHPTQKPLALAQRALRNSSLQDEAVLDVFLGSGSTLIAAESLGRRCYGIELDGRYIDALIRRHISFVGVNKVSEEIRQKYLREAHQ
jgi:DNA modification methylase